MDVIYTDFKAAFDRVSIDIMLLKLDKFGFGDPLLAWFRSYLIGRSYRVRAETSFSDSFVATSDVYSAQGSKGCIINPPLFVNDCVNVLPTDSYLLYAR